MNSRTLVRIGMMAAFFVLFIGQSEMQGQDRFPEIERALERAEYGNALSMISAKLANDPKNERLYYYRGKAYFDQEAWSQAKSAFNLGAKYGSRFPMNFIGLGSVYAVENNFEEAKLNFDRALELNKTNSSDILIAVAEGYLGSTDLRFTGEAEKILYKVKSLEKDNTKAYVALGNLYLAQNVYELALSNYEKAIELDETFLPGYLRAGQLQVRQKEYNKGADYFRAALKQEPDYAPAFKELGELWYLAGKFNLAKENYRKYVDLRPTELGPKLRYAKFLYLTGEYEPALTMMEELSKDTSSVVMLRLMGYCSVELNQTDKAKGYLDKYFAGMASQPKFILASDHEAMGKVYQQMKDDEKALAEFDKAIAIDPERTDIFGNLGESYFKNKDYPNAAKYYGKFVEAGKPKFKDWFYYANSYYYQQDYENADKAFASIAEKYPTTHIGFLYRGRIAATQDPENTEWKAKPFYQEVWNLLTAKEDANDREGKDLKEAAQYLGFYEYSQGKGENCEPSLPYWAKVLELDPENEGANQIIDFCKSKGFEVPEGGGTKGGE